MPEPRAQYPVTPQMHALMRAQRVSALKVERAEKRERLRRAFVREQRDACLQRYGVTRDDPRWPGVQRAIARAVDRGMDFQNNRACRKVADKVLADLERKQRREQTDVVYYVRVADLVKIGTTGNLKRRIKAYPPNAELLATEPGSYNREAERLEQFASHLVAGNEWFTAAPELLAHIAAVKAQAA